LTIETSGHAGLLASRQEKTLMITLCIRYTLNPTKLADFEAYARELPAQIKRCGGQLRGYYLPTKFAGPTNGALALIDFPSLAAYEQYRAKLATDPEAVESVCRIDRTGAVLNEERSILQRVPESGN
jgi:hypothetical protein